jgi:putative protein-disulfide isomerase
LSLELLYFANPMCSWCWGFAPSVRALAEAGHRVTLALGSLDADRARPLRPEDKLMSAGTGARRRAKRPALRFRLLRARDGFVYDTAPACRAVDVIRHRFPALALPAFARLQERFYALGHDVTDPLLLREAAAEFGIEPEAFDARVRGAETAGRVAAEWQQTARLGVTGYPDAPRLRPWPAGGRDHRLRATGGGARRGRCPGEGRVARRPAPGSAGLFVERRPAGSAGCCRAAPRRLSRPARRAGAKSVQSVIWSGRPVSGKARRPGRRERRGGAGAEGAVHVEV